MYLLILLATFVSAIYGYNLSARPDYDRDVARKKAMGLVYKFVYQNQTVKSLVSRVSSGMYNSTGLGLPWVLPGDLIYADFSNTDADKNEETTLFYKQGTDVKRFYQRLNNKDGKPNDDPTAPAADYMLTGHALFDANDVVSKTICLDNEMQKSNVNTCTSETNEDGDVQSSCCNTSQNRFLVTYKRHDARWMNRITNGISLDFMRAIADRSYNDCIGIIHWDGHQWQFQGKINFQPVYVEEMRAYEEAHKNDEDRNTRYYPAEWKDRTQWALPKRVFGSNFFQDKDGKNVCSRGCLFKIQYF